MISIIGSSGSGKSTFLRCINFLEKPSEGSISVNNEMIHLVRDKDGQLKVADKNQLRRLRTSLTMVFQHFNLWSHLTVLENVMEAPVRVLGLSKESARERAMKYLSKVGIDERAQSKYPANLSGDNSSECPLPGLWRWSRKCCCSTNPLRHWTRNWWGSAENHEAAGRRRKTMVVVTHEMEFARHVSSQVIFLHQGKIEEQGPPSGVFGNPQSPRLRQFLSGALK